MASRWKSSFDVLEFQRFHSSVTISFFAAPPSYCIQSYVVELLLENAYKGTTTTVAQKDLQMNENGTLIGKAIFRELQRGKNYSIKLVPQAKRTDGTCVCEFQGVCDCVTINSHLFDLPEFRTPLGVTPVTTVDIPANSSDSSSTVYIVVAAAFFILTLILLSLALLLRIFRNTDIARKQNLLLVFNNKRNLDREQAIDASQGRPLLKKIQSVLIINADPARQRELEFLARALETVQIKVHFVRWEQRKIEENLQLWVHSVLSASDKILLFHEQRGFWLLSEDGRKRKVGLQRDLYDDVFCALHSSIVYSDPRIIHLKWDAHQEPMFCNPENMYLLPRDLKHVFGALRSNLTDAEIKHYQEEFIEIVNANAQEQIQTSEIKEGEHTKGSEGQLENVVHPLHVDPAQSLYAKELSTSIVDETEQMEEDPTSRLQQKRRIEELLDEECLAGTQLPTNDSSARRNAKQLDTDEHAVTGNSDSGIVV